jgi:hypothetical protein
VAGENNEGTTETYTKEQVETMIAEREAGLKANRDEAVREAKKAKELAKRFDGIDPDEARTLKEQAAEAERKKALAEGNLEVWKKQVTDQHQKEKSELEKRLGKYESFTSKTLRNEELRKELIGKADPSMMELLVEHGSKYIHVRETDEGFEKYVGDEKGNAMVADAQGTAMSTAIFVDQVLKAKFPGAFLGSGSSGGGATRSNSGGVGGSKTISKDDLFKGDNLQRLARGEIKVEA